MQQLSEAQRALIEGLDDSYVEALATFDDSKVRHAGIHASEISKCYRQAVYTMRGEPKSPRTGSKNERAYWRKVLEHGHAIHSMLQHQFAKLGERVEVDFEEETPLAPDLQELAKKWNIHSSCDGIFTFYKKTWKKKVLLRLGLEIKSASAQNFRALTAPPIDHVEQAHVYMAVLDLPAVWFVYFNKDTQSHTPSKPPWIVEFNETLWHKLEDRFAMFHEHVNAGTIPDAMPGSQCKFCPYVPSCKPPGVPERKVQTPRFGKNRLEPR